MEKGHDFDPSDLDTAEELQKVVGEQEVEEQKAEDKRYEADMVADKADKLVESMKSHEQFQDQQRIKDELSDRKEEDGGEVRE